MNTEYFFQGEIGRINLWIWANTVETTVDPRTQRLPEVLLHHTVWRALRQYVAAFERGPDLLIEAVSDFIREYPLNARWRVEEAIDVSLQSALTNECYEVIPRLEAIMPTISDLLTKLELTTSGKK